MNTLNINLITLYGPNSDKPNFYNNIETIINDTSSEFHIICGDFNLIFDTNKDCMNYRNINNPRSREKVLNMLNTCDLMDTYRAFHPDTKRFTWRKKNPLKQARLDYFLVSNSMRDLIDSCNIKPSYRSDHSILELKIFFSQFKIGRGTWKLNNSLLKNEDYLKLIKSIILEEKLKYAVPVYKLEYIENSYSSKEVNFVIDDDTFLEALFLRVRGETIKFSSILKKKVDQNERDLIRDIEVLEGIENLSPHKSQILDDKKQELEGIRELKMQGHVVRSRVNWLHEGEKASKYFCALEKRNFTEKTIRKLKLNNGDFTTNQKIILNSIREFYSNLFRDRKNNLKGEDLNTQLGSIFQNKDQFSKVNTSFGGLLTVTEVSEALKNLKNNKTPGIDGLSAEVFWLDLKHLVTRALNMCYKKGALSTSLRESIITCLPKGDKDRTLLKHWRPISLLSVTYKLASTAIAARIKPFLNEIISKSQTGFLSGRNISESTRLVYDIMHFTETKKINGLLMLIDFKKAFDSLSWPFLYKVLEYFGFNNDLIDWIKLFNNNIIARVIQSGFLSEPIVIQ